jgi:hypothetical protein
MPWEEVEQVFRPENAHVGVMEVDAETCTKCGPYVLSCTFRAFQGGPACTPCTRMMMEPRLKEKLGIREPWRVCSSMLLGYPKFKQGGVVARELRPVTWFREGAEGPELEDWF